MNRRCSSLGERSWERNYSDEGERQKRREKPAVGRLPLAAVIEAVPERVRPSYGRVQRRGQRLF